MTFCQASQSQAVLESIKKSTRTMAGLASAISGTDDEGEAIPLLPLNDPHKSPSLPLDPLPIIDRLTSSLVKAIALARTTSQSSSPQNYAHDSISGRASGTLKAEDCIKVFEPVGLSLFDTALLAHVVHDNAPIYGLFDNHCYMFASVIFDTIVQLYSFPGVLNPPTSISQIPLGGVPAPSPEVDEPQNANLIYVPCPDSDKSGRWSGLLVLDPLVMETIVCVVIEQFKPLRTHYLQPFFNK
jgi:hypothetical protein